VDRPFSAETSKQPKILLFGGELKYLLLLRDRDRGSYRFLLFFFHRYGVHKELATDVMRFAYDLLSLSFSRRLVKNECCSAFAAEIRCCGSY